MLTECVSFRAENWYHREVNSIPVYHMIPAKVANCWGSLVFGFTTGNHETLQFVVCALTTLPIDYTSDYINKRILKRARPGLQNPSTASNRRGFCNAD